ncbi:hypothetical protein IV203_002807 [Nitzschia inconspicua]|uniref:Uncharacterized protein n=1 Tax=Nitzschia inconspicua TaxID=303405 RepID=A0A9K3L116_9STRA|nr:hypothetical protein IV203_002807 [Nitzschia inconspicua]
MTSTKKIHRKLHNDKIRKEAEERDRVRMLKNDSKGHPSVARLATLIDKGWSEEEFQSTLFYKPSFFRKRVQRVALPSNLLYYRVRAVFVTFGMKKDSKTGLPLFNDEAWKKASNLLGEIKRGFYSDPPGFDFYAFEMTDMGKIKKDTNGIPLLRCCRGTNLVECVHKQYNTTFRHKTGIEMGDAQISERRHRHNLDMAQRVYRDFPNVGHYDTWKIDVLQKLVEQNTGKLLFPGWACVSDYFETDESFVTVPMHTSDLHDKLLRKVQQLEEIGGYNPRLSSDVKFICKSWGMAHLWIEHVNGRDIFPKLPVQLKKYHRYWERNRRIQVAMDRAKSDIELLNSYLTKSVPLELEAGYNVDDTAGDAIAELDGEVGLGGRETGNDLGREHQHVEVRPPAQHRNAVGNSNMVSLSLQELMLRNQMAMFASYMRRNLQAPNFPAAMPLPLPVNRKRPADALPISVAGETIAAMTGFIPDLHREKRRTRGKGKRTRQPPTCVYCRDSSDPEVRNSAKKCPGRWPRGTCQRK